MANIQLPTNLEDVAAEMEFKVAEPGTYELEIVAVEEKTGKNSGKPYLNFRLKIVDDEEFAGVNIFDIASLSPDALFRLKQISLAAGIEISEEFDTEDFVGETISAVVDQEQRKNADGTAREDDDGNPVMQNVIKSYIWE